MIVLNSCAKGKAGEREVIRMLRQYWPDACRNLDQCREVSDTLDVKSDALNTAGVHFQIKRVEKLNVWEALRQANSEASQFDIPVLAFRRNRGEWYGALPLDELLALLALRDL